MEIYYEKDGQKIGPIEISTIEPNVISRDTLVWHADLDSWIKAKEVPELKPYLKSLPPPLPTKKEIHKKEVCDADYEEDFGATVLGVMFLILFDCLYAIRTKLLPDTDQNYFLAFTAIVQLGCAFFVTRVANDQNRHPGGWFFFAFFVPVISLIILGQLSKLKEEQAKSTFEKDLDQVNQEDSQ